MGRKDKKKHRKRSRSRSKRGRRSRSSSYFSSAESSDSEYEHRRRHKISKHSSYKTERSRDRSDPTHHRYRDDDHHYREDQHDRRRDEQSRERSQQDRSPSPDQSRRKKVDEDKIKKKQQKELMKALETPEQKRARRLAKKEAKERKRKEQSGWDEEYMGYTNADNPFGDEHLLDTFVWKKKLEGEGKHQLGEKEIQQLQKRKMIENKIELEKVKKRRLEREREREERNLEHEMMQRDKEVEYFREWEKQEDTFHLKQARLRSKIRIDDGRAKPIDLLAKYISMEDDELEVEMHEPYVYLNGLTISDLEDLLVDIKIYVELEESKNTDYWNDITIIVEDELQKLRKIDPNTKDMVRERRTGINASVMDDVAGVFKGKSLGQLQALEQSIHTKIQGGKGVDVGYWESLLQQLKAFMARSRLREKHQELLLHKLFKLKQEQCIDSGPLFPVAKASPKPTSSPRDTSVSPAPSEPNPGTSSDVVPGTNVVVPGCSDALPGGSTDNPEEIPLGSDSDVSDEGEGHAATTIPRANNSEGEENEGEEATQNETDYLAGSYSPELLQASDLEVDTLIYDPADDIRRLEYARSQVLKIGVKLDSETEFMKKAKEGMNDEEATFSVQVPLEHTMAWSDKYRPRKPRFFNRVHTGFEWNKYNQTHYDIDNPPPKIVQGYKFNIFYPDLIDKTKTPEYTLTPIEDAPEFCILCFKSGPPYEDIAFKIVSREWEYSYKRGFRCQFHNNIFQLWFHFKRYRYRR